LKPTSASLPKAGLQLMAEIKSLNYSLPE